VDQLTFPKSITGVGELAVRAVLFRVALISRPLAADEDRARVTFHAWPVA
jgi:hypothetical protein